MAETTSGWDSAFRQDHAPQGDAQAQAALLLVESLIHTLIDNGTLSKAQALGAVESAFDVKEESVDEGKEPPDTLRRSLALLSTIRNSIEAHSGPYPEREAGSGVSAGSQGGETASHPPADA